MASSELTLEQIYSFLKEKGGKVKNRDAVRYFKGYLTDPQTKEENRIRFKTYVNTLTHTKTENDEKVLILKTKYLNSLDPPVSSGSVDVISSPHNDPRNSIGIPISPSLPDFSPSTPRQPPPYRPPPPVYSPSPSLDNISLGSLTSLNDTPQAPPRRRDLEKTKSLAEDVTPKKANADPDGNGEEKQTVSVKERTQKFNRLASVEDELSPRQMKSPEKDKSKSTWARNGADEDDGASVIPLEPKKCMEWYVTASKGDFQELLKLAHAEPRLVNKKDPFTTVLHWGAKYGNADIIKIFAGKYKVDVNGKTGYTPLHISAQFGHKDIFKLLIEVYKADTNIRDYSGRTPEYYLLAKEQKEGSGITLRKIKGRKKQTEKDLGFLRIGSLNVRVKKTTEAFSNFLGVGGGGVNPGDAVNEKVLKGWGSADNVNKEDMAAPKGYVSKKKAKRMYESGGNSTPTTPKAPAKTFNSLNCNDSDSDSAAGFDCNWKN